MEWAANARQALALRDAYDQQLRDTAEIAHARQWDRDGPILRAVFDQDFGFITYRTLGALAGDGPGLDSLITRAIAHFRERTSVREVEWKTRGHDLPRDLSDRLRARGFEPGEPETVMIGAAQHLAQHVALPQHIRLRRIGRAPDGATLDIGTTGEQVEQMLRLQAAVFGQAGHQSATELTRRIVDDQGHLQAWVAEVQSTDDDSWTMVSAGRLEIVEGTQFAGIWGGATLPEWRGRGIYRALTSARAQAAMARGVQFIHSDCTEFSRPILQQAGLTPVTTTPPFSWHREPSLTGQ